jgi:DNA invertase Pin-like site-specific DNA recombinase
MIKSVTSNLRQVATFEDLRGLRAECYIRDSTLDQRDGYGPDIQRHNEQRFAESYGLVLGNRWYTEFVSGRSVDKRHEFQRFLEDARLDLFDVLLVDHTSRFGRNQAECIRYKNELKRLEKTVIFVSQGIISGSDRDFLNERINETLDEQYSRNLSRYISAGLAEKAQHGFHIGPTPFGYKSEIGPEKRERKVPDPQTMPGLLMALRAYAAGNVSYSAVADRLNADGFRLQTGRLFTGYSVRDIMANRFYEGKVVYHEGQADELIVSGLHDVPEEIKELWARCQVVKRTRALSTAGHPVVFEHIYPFSRVLKCHHCGSPYHGEAVYYHGITDLRMTHERRTVGKHCEIRPRSRSVALLSHEFDERVVSCIHLNNGWKNIIVKSLIDEQQPENTQQTIDKVTKAMENLRKQHLWGDISDSDYRRDRAVLEHQIKELNYDCIPRQLPNIERAAHFLDNLPELWSHPGVTEKQRGSLVQEMFTEIGIEGTKLVSIKPKPTYAPLFATMVVQNSLGYCDLNSPPPPPQNGCFLERH